MNRDMTEPKVVIERSPEDHRTTHTRETQTGHTEGCHVCVQCGRELGLIHRATGHRSHQHTHDTHPDVYAQDQPCSQETQSVSSEETQSEHSVSAEETQGLGECSGTTITGKVVQLGSHGQIYHGPVYQAPVNHFNIYVQCPDCNPHSIQELTGAVRGALENSDDINSPVKQPNTVEAETSLRLIQASSASSSTPETSAQSSSHERQSRRSENSPVQQPHQVEAETALKQIQASSASSSTPETSAQSSRHARQPRRSENSPVQQPHPASSAAPETSAQSSRHERQPRRSETGEMGDREDVAIVDSRGQTILPGDAVFCEGHRCCLYIGGLEVVWCTWLHDGVVRREQLDLTRPFEKLTVLSGRCPVFSPQERVTRAVGKVGQEMTARELEPVYYGWRSHAFLAWVFTGLSATQAKERGFNLKW